MTSFNRTFKRVLAMLMLLVITFTGLGAGTLEALASVEHRYNSDSLVRTSLDEIKNVLTSTSYSEYLLSYNDASVATGKIVVDLANGIDAQDTTATVNVVKKGDDLGKYLVDKNGAALTMPEGVDAKYLSAAMQQSDLQVQLKNYYDEVLTICGVPNRNGGSSTSDTGSAVIMRDGWESAEAQMKSVELEFKRSEKEFLRLALRILRDMTGLNLDLKNVEIKFSRRNYDNLQTKSQVLTTLLNNPKVHPQLAFVHSGLFLDPESAYLQSKEYWEANAKKAAEIANPAEEEEEAEVPTNDTIEMS